MPEVVVKEINDVRIIFSPYRQSTGRYTFNVGGVVYNTDSFHLKIELTDKHQMDGTHFFRVRGTFVLTQRGDKVVANLYDSPLAVGRSTG